MHSNTLQLDASVPELAVVPTDHGDPTGDTVMVATARLRGGLSPRRGGVDPRHVEALVEAGGGWPPLLVQRSTMRVIDGMHRLTASQRLGLREVAVVLFEGTVEEARVQAIVANVKHGLPLTIDERKASARLVLSDHPLWSDRHVAEICGLSSKTVATLRPPGLTTSSSGPEKRVGRDGRLRPVRPSDVRERILVALSEDPSASLRAIAARVGASPETVRSVRRSIECRPPAGELVGQPSLEPAPSATATLPTSTSPSAVIADVSIWATDAALASTDHGRTFAAWFEATAVDHVDVDAFVGAVPLSRIYGVADEALRRARVWQELAQRLRDRI